MTINATRLQFYLKFKNDPVPGWFKHQPAASKPAQPTYPSTLTGPQKTAVENWRQARGTAKATLYTALSGATKTMADAFIAWDAARSAWESTDKAGRQEQYAWFRADVAIDTYPTVPPSGDSGGSGSGGPSVPTTKQEP